MTKTANVKDIRVEKAPSEQLEKMEVFTWPIWTTEEKSFPWEYAQKETCYFLEGDVTVKTPDGGELRIGKGDLVTFPRGLQCTWEVRTPVRKHYRFG
jgi:uncharacterized protein